MMEHAVNAEELKARDRQVFNELARDYVVNDILPEQMKFLFLLESPHVQELIFGAPVSGSSGTSMTRHLLGTGYDKPLGILVKKNRDEGLNRPSLNKIGLMNVCQIPMQGTAYKDRALHERCGDFFKILEGVRTTNQRTVYTNPEWNAVQEIIVQSLREKLQKLTDRPLYVVPCGRFAQKFFRLADVCSPHWQVIDEVPHPSYNNWSKSSATPVIGYLTGEFARA